MKLLVKQLIKISIILLPITMICVLLSRQVDLYNLITGIENVQIIEDIGKYKDFLKEYNFTNAPTIDSFNAFLEYIAYTIKWIVHIVILTVNLFVISPIRTLLDIFNLLFV